MTAENVASGGPLSPAQVDKALAAVREIRRGPRALQLYLEICAKCGTCARQCHVSQSSPLARVNPARRTDHLRKLYALDNSVLRRTLLALTQGKDAFLDSDTLEDWIRDFYECTECRRCALYCPLGIDNSVIVRMGRSILDSLGLTPAQLARTQAVSEACGNNEGVPRATIREILGFIESEIQEEYGVAAKIPLDQKAEVLFATASSAILAKPENLMGCALFFHAAGISWTMSTRAFDAANFGLFTGNERHKQQKYALLQEACLELQARTLVIGECGHAYTVAMQQGGHAGWSNALPYRTTNIFSLAAEVLRKGGIRLDKERNQLSVTYHDPCNFARSCGIWEEPRRLLRAAVREFREMTPNRAANWCCGGGGGLAPLSGLEGVRKREQSFYAFRMQVTGRKKYEQIAAAGAQYVAAPCFNCMRQIEQLVEYYHLDVAVGGVFELVGRALVL